MTNHTPLSDEIDSPDDDVYQTEFDPTTDSISTELITTIATLNGADPAELALLSDFVDPETLDALFGPRAAAGPRETNGHVSFDYDAYHVEVDNSGQITVHHSEPSSSSEQSPGDID